MTNSTRYHSFAIALHWIMALGFMFMAGSGWYMVNGDLPKAEQFDLYQIHKASGVLMLWALVLRVFIKFVTYTPLLPNSIPKEQKKMAKLGHVSLYIGLLLIPVTGWVMVSASPFGLPTLVFFDWLKWPHIPGLAKNREAQIIASNVHWYGVLTMLLLIVGHISAVYVHTVKHNIKLIRRMWWN
ncbi:cytochrome b [Alteromonas sp. 5E99-2]|uniref:cytochrome b n=1 Tax=Alteromonas sp. 5E99-2 TaxID=2817683 RepID=UPI001A97DCBC|nr:cytochrome b [Alteromonas sp. 5E99-2]MBO1254443.1 cytochrome b [Alteromonas sp. 5E99-2]